MITGRERNPTSGVGKRAGPPIKHRHGGHTVIHTHEIDLTVLPTRSNSSGVDVERVDNPPPAPVPPESRPAADGTCSSTSPGEQAEHLARRPPDRWIFRPGSHGTAARVAPARPDEDRWSHPGGGESDRSASPTGQRESRSRIAPAHPGRVPRNPLPRADLAVGEPGHSATKAAPGPVLACRAVTPAASCSYVSMLVGSGSPPNPGVAWTAVPALGGTPVRDEPVAAGCLRDCPVVPSPGRRPSGWRAMPGFRFC
jgi:hypothetical protein